MKHPILACWLVLAIMVVGLSSVSKAQDVSPRIVTLGADLSPQQRAAVLQRLGASDADKPLTITTDDMRAEMNGIIPIPPGYTSVSSTALRCRNPGSGLTVAAENITRVTPSMYGLSLLTAGMYDGDLIVAAPQDAPAEGMTALAGLFKALNNGGCGHGNLDPTRRDLAHRELALTANLADATGGDYVKASDFVLRAHAVLIREKNNPDAAYPIVDGVQNNTGITLKPEQRKSLAELLAAIGQAHIDWAEYAGGVRLDQVGDTEVHFVPAGAPPSVASQGNSSGGGRTLTGAIAPGDPLHIIVPGNLPPLQLNATNVVVRRNNTPAHISDLKPGDSVTVVLGANNDVQQITAQAPERMVDGTAGTRSSGKLAITTVNGKEQIATAGLPVVRDGKRARVEDIQSGDIVSLSLDGTGRPILLIANSGSAGAGYAQALRRFWWIPLLLILLLGLIPLLRRRQESGRPLVIARPRRTTARPAAVVSHPEPEDEDDLNL